MPKSKLVDIQFCFPRFFGESKKAFVDALIRNIQSNKKIGYAGYSYKKYLREAISYRFNDDNIKDYKLLPTINKNKLIEVVQSVVHKCDKELPLLTPPLFVFVFPWFPQKNTAGLQGVTGFTPYSNTIHLFISPNKFSIRSLMETIAHEFNHAIFFHNHPFEQTLIDTIIFEGLAGNFEEEIINRGHSAPSIALTIKESKRVLHSLEPLLNSKDYNLYRDVFFGNKKYKKWTGYSIGYWIVKSFRKKYPTLSWKKIMEMSNKKILDKSTFI